MFVDGIELDVYGTREDEEGVLKMPENQSLTDQMDASVWSSFLSDYPCGMMRCSYEEYPQIENGVGMLRSFSDDFGIALEDIKKYKKKVKKKREVTVVTGVASYPLIKRLSELSSKFIPKLKINVVKVINHFFGESITVSGLLTGRDIYDALSSLALGDEVLIPANALRYPEEDFLCGMTLSSLSEKLGVKASPAGEDGFQFLEAVTGVHLE